MSSIQEPQHTHIPRIDQREKDYPDSSFFSLPSRHLPTLVEVRARSHDAPRGSQPQFLVLDHLDLFVNFGPYVKVAEAQCLQLSSRLSRGGSRFGGVWMACSLQATMFLST
ncbi:uncharacterized protein BDW47DRAFT_107471 [Aspergillus candidus]|uniref:Uncharacterized protein n=1 Tax=Aspergillus candidus TaxID=41067 RepID=A0A2I2F946_ASPCN|nr:hypothetical protein BDW47DRAFT_107471 [Aspergillus candidus]PLB37150.1 hypothetical protein BDW47DRAFT_107471 [Aspergillus candidus]